MYFDGIGGCYADGFSCCKGCRFVCSAVQSHARPLPPSLSPMANRAAPPPPQLRSLSTALHLLQGENSYVSSPVRRRRNTLTQLLRTSSPLHGMQGSSTFVRSASGKCHPAAPRWKEYRYPRPTGGRTRKRGVTSDHPAGRPHLEATELSLKIAFIPDQRESLRFAGVGPAFLLLPEPRHISSSRRDSHGSACRGVLISFSRESPGVRFGSRPEHASPLHR